MNAENGVPPDETREDSIPPAERDPFFVPWGIREVLLGAAWLVPWFLISFMLLFILRLLFKEVNVGLIINIAELTLLIPLWYLGIRHRAAGWRTLGLRRFDPVMILFGLGLMAVSYGFNLFYGLLLHYFDLQIQKDLVPVLADMPSPWLFFIGGVVIAPVVEEMFFRGFVFTGLCKRFDWKKAAVLSSALFALIHLQPTAFLPIFLLGFIFCYLYYKSRSLWPSILMHVVSNAFSLGIAFYVAKSGDFPK